MKQILSWSLKRFPINLESLNHFSSEPVPMHLKHWWWCLGGTPAYLLVIQIITGIMLSFHYVPTPDQAYESVRLITEELSFGWYIRSLHKWCSNFMIVAVAMHMLRVFFTGSYRAPRELTWITGMGLLICTLMWGFTGYSLIYEQLSFWGATVAGNLTEAVPFIGPMMADFIRGGEKVGGATLTRFYIFHIGLIPTIALGLLLLHLALVRLHGVTEFNFKEDNDKESKTFPFFPDHFLSELGIGVFLMSVLTFLAIVFPAGLEEAANPLVTPAHIKPEWYFYFTFRWLKMTSLTFAVLSVGLGAFMLIMWPLIDTLFRRKNKNSEMSVYIGIAGVIALLALTLWEAIALFTSH